MAQNDGSLQCLQFMHWRSRFGPIRMSVCSYQCVSALSECFASSASWQRAKNSEYFTLFNLALKATQSLQPKKVVSERLLVPALQKLTWKLNVRCSGILKKDGSGTDKETGEFYRLTLKAMGIVYSFRRRKSSNCLQLHRNEVLLMLQKVCQWPWSIVCLQNFTGCYSKADNWPSLTL